jgi:hypothetical protein
MQISSRSFVPAALALALVAYAAPSHAQQGSSEPLKLSAPAPHQAERPAAPQGQAPAQAPDSGAQAQTQTASGELLEVDAKGNTISIRTAGAEMKFRFNEQTKVSGAQKGVAGLATMTGQQVTVTYRKDGASNIATNIEVQEKK